MLSKQKYVKYNINPCDPEEILLTYEMKTNLRLLYLLEASQ